MRLYRLERVERTEATPEFAMLRDIGAARSDRSRTAAARRASALLAAARAYRPTLPNTLDRDRLIRRAIRAYNEAHAHHGGYVGLDDDPEFLARIAWNHFRHHMTNWDAAWSDFSGKPGVRDAYLAAATALVAHVGERFAELREAATAWLAHKRGDSLHAAET